MALQLMAYQSVQWLGKASKIIVPTDAVNAVKANVLFSETAGIGDVTASAAEEAPASETDPCCDKFDKE